MEHLFNLDLQELQAAVANLGFESYRAKQLWDHYFIRGQRGFEAANNLPSKLVQSLSDEFSIARLKVAEDQLSIDGTRKWLLELEDGSKIETVYIPEKDRGTLCISSQVGCTLNCTFCHTGTQSLVRNLTAAEIVLQFIHARDCYQDWSGPLRAPKITNIVMMGMGEPLLNYENVAKALKIITHKNGMNFAKRRVTLSTSGIVPAIERCATELGVNLALSLHATNDELRNQIVPINKKYPLEPLLEVCRKYLALSKTDKVTFEYVMLKGVNDSIADAKALLKLIKGIPCKINLIPFNPWPGTQYECSDMKEIKKFAKIIEDAGYISPIRTPRGQDIFAACGQLKSASERLRAQ